MGGDAHASAGPLCVPPTSYGVARGFVFNLVLVLKLVEGVSEMGVLLGAAPMGGG